MTLKPNTSSPLDYFKLGDLSVGFLRPHIQGLLEFGEKRKTRKQDRVAGVRIYACQTIFRLHSQNIQQHHPWCPAGSVARPEMSLQEQCVGHQKAVPSHCYIETGWRYSSKKTKRQLSYCIFKTLPKLSEKTNKQTTFNSLWSNNTQTFVLYRDHKRKPQKFLLWNHIHLCVFLPFLSHIQGRRGGGA